MFRVPGSRFVFRFAFRFGFEVHGSKFGGGTSNPEPRTLNLNANLNTNLERGTWNVEPGQDSE
jgi:hypothetical protein